MKYLIILLASLALVCTPLQAQPDVGETTADVLEAATEGAQSLGVAAFVSIVVSVIVLVIVVGGTLGLLLFIYKGGLKPVFDLVDKANKQTDDANRRASEERQERLDTEMALTEYRERQARAAQIQADAAVRQAEASERLVERMSEIETAEQASQGRVSAVTELKEHVTAELQPVAQDMGQMRQTLDEAVGEIKKASQRLDELATKADLQTELSPIKQGLDALATRLTTLETHLAPPTAPPTPES